MERTRERIILEHTDLQITVINLENPQGWKESALRCGKPEHQPGQKSPAKNAKCNAMTLPQGMPVQEKRQESQSCPDTTPG